MGSLDHVLAAADAILHRVADVHQQTGRSHERIADGLDLLHIITLTNHFEGLYQPLQIANYLFRGMPFAVIRKVHNIGEKNGHLVVTLWEEGAGSATPPPPLRAESHATAR